MMTQSTLVNEDFEKGLTSLRNRFTSEDSLTRMRQQAWDLFNELKLPSQQDEKYRKIKLKHLFSRAYEAPNLVSLSSDQIQSYIDPECQNSVIVLVNGKFEPSLSKLEDLPKKLVVSTLDEALLSFGTFLTNYWNQTFKDEQNVFAVLNAALHEQGVFIYLPPNTQVECPVQILHLIHTQDSYTLLSPRVHVFVGAQSELKIISTQQFLTSDKYFVNQVEEIVLEEGAHVRYNQVCCDESPTSWHFSTFRALLKRNSTLNNVCVTEGSETTYHDYHVTLAGENTEALLNSVWMLADRNEAHSHVFMDHQAPNCRSFQLFKGVLKDFSRSSFEGKIMVRQKAQKTEAFQLNNNLLMHPATHADSKPNLEIFADDVKASHGATVGQLDSEQLFYLKTRGFSDEDAKNLLIYGFCKQIIDMLELQSVKDSVSQRVKKNLKKD